ncbi:family 10 glycosylhydrolase [Dolichospermum planctonicum UHCC 0167]|uniref:family 10 glycosylhydrolase n=1 Tax=Dolichospermum planctonicum TaxID=136072 RepID=UPI001442E80F|nr:family 10 glycosylhydrolase [Dolichospermum planctonicum]MCW9681051.1 family 10 glycosylhydrolase [Dolichospermum planctonicum UHCC 0167]
MSQPKKEPNGCGCANIPFSLIIVIFGGGYWWFSQKGNSDISKFLPQSQQLTIPILNPTPIASTIPTSASSKIFNIPSNPQPIASAIPVTAGSSPSNIIPNNQLAIKKNLPQTNWQKKVIRGIYLSRYQVSNNANEQTIRDRVRYYHSQGFNTIIHGVWGNGCTMYNSKVMQQTLGYKSCPNLFQDQWLDWLIDEAHKQDMQVHAYFEKGIKIDKNSPIFDLAIAQKWIVPGIDKTYAAIDHYVLDVEIPQVANFFKNILVEFVQRYPKIDAVQWDDYLGYHAELPGKVDRTTKLTTFVQQMITGMKQANSTVSFDICHHNPYWSKRYFAADWQKWNVDRVFIQAYNDANFPEELNYVKNSAGIAITEKQFHRLKEIVNNPAIKSVLVFPASGKPEATASTFNSLIMKSNGLP